MEVIVECVFISREDVQHLDPRKIITDGGRFEGAAEKLYECAYGVNSRRQGILRKIHAKAQVAAKLGPQVRIGAFGKGM